MSVRKSVTRFRLSNHKLLIEVGRHQNINLSERICPLCSQSVEDEAHFLFACPAYQYQRELFLNPTMEKHPNFVRWSKPQKIELIMSNMDHNVCNYISRSMEIRDFLSNKPKRVTQAGQYWKWDILQFGLGVIIFSLWFMCEFMSHIVSYYYCC